jgi:hypothetical protein
MGPMIRPSVLLDLINYLMTTNYEAPHCACIYLTAAGLSSVLYHFKICIPGHRSVSVIILLTECTYMFDLANPTSCLGFLNFIAGHLLGTLDSYLVSGHTEVTSVLKNKPFRSIFGSYRNKM